jgi:hypothetical protein
VRSSPPSLGDPCAEPWHFAIAGDAAPYVGTSSVAPDQTRLVSFNLLGGYARGVRAFALSAGVNLDSSFACGLQVAGGANVVSGSLDGAEVAGGADIITGRLRGVQTVGGLALVGGPLTGAQIATVSVALDDVQGAQVSAAAVAKRALDGAQISAFNYVGGRLRGLEIASANVALDTVEGAQIGAVNVTRGKVKGLQIGAVNYADDSDASIGAVTVLRHGRTSLETWGTEAGLAMFGVRHGGRLVHNVYGAGYHLAGGGAWAMALGIGLRVPLGSRLRLDLDVMSYAIQRGKPFVDAVQLSAFQPWLGFALDEHVDLFAGPSFDVAVARSGSPDLSPPWGTIRFSDDVHAWPGAALGVRANL